MGVVVINDEDISPEMIEDGDDSARSILGRRRADRRSCRLPGRVYVLGGRNSVNCTVVDESSMGARLQLASTKVPSQQNADRVPSEFWLYFPLEKVRVKCQRVWENNNDVGVRFWSTMQPA